MGKGVPWPSDARRRSGGRRREDKRQVRSRSVALVAEKAHDLDIETLVRSSFGDLRIDANGGVPSGEIGDVLVGKGFGD